VGVAGLRGGGEFSATNRRARLVEHAVTSHLVTPADLYLLEEHNRDKQPPEEPSTGKTGEA